eukprot:GHVQ01032374.1.p1 GENE.GHVQ01032374.1~~GHVQ01032374.1.p1  ORF type:complete len:546 (-),score=101.57 GHVQ01032374.1:1215-2852(-)
MWWCGGGGGVGYTFLVLSLTMAMEDPTDKQTVNQLSVHTHLTATATEQQLAIPLPIVHETAPMFDLIEPETSRTGEALSILNVEAGVSYEYIDGEWRAVLGQSQSDDDTDTELTQSAGGYSTDSSDCSLIDFVIAHNFPEQPTHGVIAQDTTALLDTQPTDLKVLAQDLKVFQTRHAGLKQTSKTDKQTVNQSNTVSQLSVHTQPTDTRTEQQPISLADVLHSPDSPTSFMQPTDTLDGTGYQNISATDTHTDSKEQPTHEVIAQDLKVFQTRHAGLKQTSKTLSMAKDTLIKARQHNTSGNVPTKQNTTADTETLNQRPDGAADMATEEMKEFKRQYDNLLNQPYVFYDDERLLSNTKKVVKMLEQEQHSQQTIEIEKPVRDMVEEVSRPAIGRRRRDEIATDFSMLVRKYQQILANINTVLEDPTKISQADAEQQLVQNLTQVREKVMENLRTLEQHSQQTIEIEKPVRDMVEEVSRPAIGRRRRDEIATDFSMLVRNQHLLANINTMLEDPTKISQADAEQQLVQNLTQAREKVMENLSFPN